MEGKNSAVSMEIGQHIGKFTLALFLKHTIHHFNDELELNNLSDGVHPGRILKCSSCILGKLIWMCALCIMEKLRMN